MSLCLSVHGAPGCSECAPEINTAFDGVSPAMWKYRQLPSHQERGAVRVLRSGWDNHVADSIPPSEVVSLHCFSEVGRSLRTSTKVLHRLRSGWSRVARRRSFHRRSTPNTSHQADVLDSAEISSDKVVGSQSPGATSAATLDSNQEVTLCHRTSTVSIQLWKFGCAPLSSRRRSRSELLEEVSPVAFAPAVQHSPLFAAMMQTLSLPSTPVKGVSR